MRVSCASGNEVQKSADLEKSPCSWREHTIGRMSCDLSPFLNRFRRGTTKTPLCTGMWFSMCSGGRFILPGDIRIELSLRDMGSPGKLGYNYGCSSIGSGTFCDNRTPGGVSGVACDAFLSRGEHRIAQRGETGFNRTTSGYSFTARSNVGFPIRHPHVSRNNTSPTLQQLPW